MLKKIITLMLSAVCLLSMGTAAFAAAFPETGSLTIVKPVKSADDNTDTGRMTFLLYDLGDYAFDYDPDDYDAARLSVIRRMNNGELDIEPIQKKTENGPAVTFTGLSINHTYFVRLSSADGERNHNYGMSSFLVTVPYTDESGNTTWNVKAEPKFERIDQARNKSADSRGVDQSSMDPDKGSTSSSTINPDGSVTTNTTSETVTPVPDTPQETVTETTPSGSVDVPIITSSETIDQDKDNADPSKYKTGDAFDPKLACIMGAMGLSLMGAGIAFKKKEG